MKLDFIALDKLSISKANMRHAKKAPNVADILPTIRQRGILQPLLVRPNCADGAFEIVAGARRFTAARLVAEETGTAEPVPCAILDSGDDADAVEASLIENVARFDPDEVARWECFTRLVREGRKVDDIAATFGLPELAVRRVLALGNLCPRIRDLYRREEIDVATVRHLTMATKAQQQDWLALLDDKTAICPTGHRVKAWLFGGGAIATEVALFDVAASGLATVGDLFGEQLYFADADAFWTAQEAAIAAKREAYLAAGWREVEIVRPQFRFDRWEHDRMPKKKGGRVYIDVSANGEVAFHEGYVTSAEARRIERGDPAATVAKPVRPEVTSTMQTYLDLHRHAAVRADLTGHPSVALRLMIAHAIVGSPLWNVRAEPQATRDDAVAESVENSAAEGAFDEKRRAVLAVLGFGKDEPTVTGGNADAYGLVGLFNRLLDLPDPAIMEMVAIVMGETLAAGSAAVEAVGQRLGIDMARWWSADDAFFGLIRDREVLTAIVGEVAGATVADANAGEKAKTLKAIVADHLAGENGRAKIERWVPKWMTFPPEAYTARGGVGTVNKAMLVDAARAGDGDGEPEPPAPAAVIALPVSLDANQVPLAA